MRIGRENDKCLDVKMLKMTNKSVQDIWELELRTLGKGFKITAMGVRGDIYIKEPDKSSDFKRWE